MQRHVRSWMVRGGMPRDPTPAPSNLAVVKIRCCIAELLKIHHDTSPVAECDGTPQIYPAISCYLPPAWPEKMVREDPGTASKSFTRFLRNRSPNQGNCSMENKWDRSWWKMWTLWSLSFRINAHVPILFPWKNLPRSAQRWTLHSELAKGKFLKMYPPVRQSNSMKNRL